MTKTITAPEQLVEKGTKYNFMKFWRDFTSDDRVWEEYDGGNFMKWGERRDLRGLCRIGYHYIVSRDNPAGKVTLKQMVDYVSQGDKLFEQRVKSQKHSLPDITLETWVKKVIDNGDKRLRKMLGLKD